MKKIVDHHVILGLDHGRLIRGKLGRLPALVVLMEALDELFRGRGSAVEKALRDRDAEDLKTTLFWLSS